MLSQFFILSTRGDTIIRRDFRGELGRQTSEVFFRKVRFWPGDPPPTFHVDGVNYFFTQKFGIYFVATTRHNVSPAIVIDIIYRMMKVFRDYCGVLSEESIRKNFVLIYEIIDEAIDYGHAQLVTTEAIRPLIVNEPLSVEVKGVGKSKSQPSLPKKTWKPSFMKSSTVSSTAIQKPISALDKQRKSKNEIFVDIFEKLTVSYLKLIFCRSCSTQTAW